MIKADRYLKETIYEILEEGQWDKEPRTRWADGTPAHSKFVTQKVFKYDISKGDFPINTLRPTALKGGFHDIEAIYIKQTNILEEMHSSIHSWWKDFITLTRYRDIDRPSNIYFESDLDWKDLKSMKRESIIGKTYGATVKRYKLVDKLLKGLEENPFGRRHKISLWQEQQIIDDPKALEPCAGLTLWSVRSSAEAVSEKNGLSIKGLQEKRYIDITLMQRSMDLAVTSSINPSQYVEFAMMVCNHLTFKTGIKHEVGKLLHVVQNCHIYDRHLDAAKEILKRKPTKLQPKIELICEPKDFYEHTVEDFKFSNLEGIEPLKEKLEIAI
jgi:thymidylate synthase